MTKVAAIETKGLCIGYLLKGGKRKVVHEDLNLQLVSGEVTCLLGLNGAGKSTLLRTLCGFQPPLGGEIRLMGKPLSGYSPANFSLTVGVVLTEKTNAGGITVYELVSLGRHPYTGFFGQLKKRDHVIIEQSLEAAGIAHKANNYVSELSDGERQKAMIAKALAQQWFCCIAWQSSKRKRFCFLLTTWTWLSKWGIAFGYRRKDVRWLAELPKT